MRDAFPASGIPSRQVVWKKGVDIASASPLILGKDGNYFDVTGTTGFSAIEVRAGIQFMLQFDGALTMTDGAGIDLAGANITTAAGDRGIFFSTDTDIVELVSWVPEGGVLTGTATQENQETGTSTALAVTSGRQHFHQSAIKGWVKFDLSGTLDASYNVASVTDTGTGDWTVNWATDFSGADYFVATDWLGTSADLRVLTRLISAQAAGTTRILVVRSSDGAAQETGISAIFCSASGDH